MPQVPEIPEKLPPTDAAEIDRERRRRINEALSDLQIRFIDRQYATAPEAATESFSRYLDAETQLIDEVRQAIAAERKLDPQESSAELEEALRPLMDDIDALRAEGVEGWSREAVRKLEAARPKIRHDRLESFGLLEYKTSANPKRVQQLSAIGLAPGDEYMEIHFRAPSREGGAFSAKAVTEPLHRLAAHIAENAPHVRAVTGKSWLMDTPAARRLGFRTMPLDSQRRKGMDYWLQFLNQDGALDEKRVGKLFGSGRAPYEVKLGGIPVEEFLERYLPKEMRGKEIALKVQKPDWKDPEPELQAAAERFKAAWPSMTDVDAYVGADKPFAAILERYGVLAEFVNDIKDAKANGLDWAAARARPSAAAIGKVLRDRIRAEKYADKIVIIPQKTP